MIRSFTIIIVLFLAWFLNHSFQERSIKNIQVNEILGTEKTPDYYSENLQLRVYNEQGKLHSVIKTDRLSHYADQRQAVIKSPELVLNGVEGNIWRVKSLSGSINDASRNIALKNNVLLSVSGADQKQKIEIITSDLHYDVLDRSLWTDSPISAESSQGNFVADGLRLDLTTEQLLLKAKVKIHYDL